MDDDLLSVELLQLPRNQVPGTGQLAAAQRLRRPCMWKRSKMKQALWIRPGSDQPEQVLLRAEALRKAFSQAKVMQPQGEWPQSGRKLWTPWPRGRSPRPKVHRWWMLWNLGRNSRLTWSRRTGYWRLNMETYMMPLTYMGYSKPIPMAIYRAYHSLKWFSKHGRLNWDFNKRGKLQAGVTRSVVL